jgi:hypothetical protein
MCLNIAQMTPLAKLIREAAARQKAFTMITKHVTQAADLWFTNINNNINSKLGEKVQKYALRHTFGQNSKTQIK